MQLSPYRRYILMLRAKWTFNCPKGYCARGSKNCCSSHVRPSVTLKTTFLRRGNGGGTCLRLPVFCRKVPKLTPLDPVLDHLFVVSELTWEHPLSKSVRKNKDHIRGPEGHPALRVYSSIKMRS